MPNSRCRDEALMPERLKVVIAEDNYLVREGVRRLLEDSGEVEVVACVGNAAELLDAVRRLTPSAVLTDIRMPPGHATEGLEAARVIRAEFPQTGILVLSAHAEVEHAMELLDPERTVVPIVTYTRSAIGMLFQFTVNWCLPSAMCGPH